MLGPGYSARLNQEVRIRRGLSYGVSCTVEAFPGGGMWSAGAQTQNATAGQVLTLLRDELLGLADRPPTDSELAARQATLVGGFARRLETPAGLAGLAIGQIVQDRPLADLGVFVEAVNAIGPADVAGFARQRWRRDALRAVVVGDLSAAGDGLSGLTDGALRLTRETLDLDQPGLRRR